MLASAGVLRQDMGRVEALTAFRCEAFLGTLRD
jgi:hypothetical protein